MDKFILLLDTCYILFLIKRIERLCFIKEVKRYKKKKKWKNFSLPKRREK